MLVSVYAVIISVFVYRELTWKKFLFGMADSALIVGLITALLFDPWEGG